jgi:hypothetical protein
MSGTTVNVHTGQQSAVLWLDMKSGDIVNEYVLSNGADLEG